MIYQDRINQRELQRYASSMNARARRLQVKGQLTAGGIRDRIFESRGCCEWCGADLVNQDFELDHVYSLSQHGSNTADNLVVACPNCNRRKSGKHPARFAAEIYGETGHKTQLLDRILRDYEITPKTQLSLFENESPINDTNLHHDDDLLSPPPYNWST